MYIVAQTVKNLPAMWETRVWSLGQEDLLEEGMAAHPSIFAMEKRRNPMHRGAWQATPYVGLQRVRQNWAANTHNAEDTQGPALSEVFGKDPDAGKDWGQEEEEMTEDEMVGW